MLPPLPSEAPSTVSSAAPSTVPSTEEIRLRVRCCVAESLAVPVAEISLDSRLTDDLGATSLDFIDIVFLVEKELGIRVRDTELAFLTRLDFSSPEVMQRGFLTEEVVARLGSFLPALAREPDPSAVTPKRLFSLVTVEALALVVERRLARIAEEASVSPTAG